MIFPPVFDPELTPHTREGKRSKGSTGQRNRKKKEGTGEESERYGLVTFNLVALHIAILHFTYDGDI